MAKQSGNRQSGEEQAAREKPAKQPKSPREKRPRDPSMPWGPWLRALVSAAILWHLTAVFVPPWFLWIAPDHKATPNTPPGELVRDAQGNDVPPERWESVGVARQWPPLVSWLNDIVFHYANLLYINNGYEFFSPNPSVAHVVDYEVMDDAGQTIAEGRLPDLRDQWPRLFYHRHMMLVEQTQTPDVPPPLRDVADTAGEWLLTKYGGESVRMTLRIHHLLTPKQVRDGMATDDPSTYEEFGSFVHRKGDVPEPNAAAETIPPPNTAIPGVSP
ncbi:MAG: hypothetical protein CMJ58_25210 [Planctomycetaceae bacterium]|nr:hypothetical protein [Planctomycetaceae bacterium]